MIKIEMTCPCGSVLKTERKSHNEAIVVQESFQEAHKDCQPNLVRDFFNGEGL